MQRLPLTGPALSLDMWIEGSASEAGVAFGWGSDSAQREEMIS